MRDVQDVQDVQNAVKTVLGIYFMPIPAVPRNGRLWPGEVPHQETTFHHVLLISQRAFTRHTMADSVRPMFRVERFLVAAARAAPPPAVRSRD